MLKLTDIISLAKAGYSLSDVKELISLASEKEEKEEGAELPTENPGTADENPTTDSSITNPQGKPNEENPDLNRIKELEEQVKTLTNQLATAQRNNINKDQSGNFKPVDPMAAVLDIFKKG